MFKVIGTVLVALSILGSMPASAADNPAPTLAMCAGVAVTLYRIAPNDVRDKYRTRGTEFANAALVYDPNAMAMIKQEVANNRTWLDTAADTQAVLVKLLTTYNGCNKYAARLGL